MKTRMFIVLLILLTPALAAGSVIHYGCDFKVVDGETSVGAFTLEFKLDTENSTLSDWMAYDDTGVLGEEGVSTVRWNPYFDLWYGYGDISFSNGWQLSFYQIDLGGRESELYQNPYQAIVGGEWQRSWLIVAGTDTLYDGFQSGPLRVLNEAPGRINEIPEPASLSILLSGLLLITARYFSKRPKGHSHEA